ncbi:MAG: hypothetical protein R3C68_04740 [Myxococcota bacterium]
MLSMQESAKYQVVSGRDLVGFHLARSSLYTAASKLLAADNDDLNGLFACIRVAAEHLGLSESWMPLLNQGVGDSNEMTMVLKRACDGNAHQCYPQGLRTRHSALQKANLDEDSGPSGDLRVLGSLAACTAQTLAQGDLIAASDYVQEQIDFLRQHARPCVLAAAAKLMANDASYARLLGSALRVLVETDLHVIESPGAASA